MNKLLVVGVLLLTLSPARAQQQERKLIDRIMEPDQTLQNNAQNKKFKADRTSVDKRAAVGTFYMEQKSTSKKYPNTRTFSSNNFNSRSFNAGKKTNAQQLSQQQAATSTYTTNQANGINSARDQTKGEKGRAYAGNRPYVEKGKSQKSLNRKNRPMTIDEVRELLNKNK